MSKQVKSAIMISSAFAAGMMMSRVLLPISGQKTNNMVEVSGRALLKKGMRLTGEFSEKFREKFSEPIPDLFEATESLSLSEAELFHG
jgi:hypothetical protein